MPEFRSSHSKDLNRRAPWVVGMVVAIVAMLLMQFGQPVAAQRSIEWTTYDVAIDLQQDGAINVAEQMTITFTGGPFTGGFAEIPLARIEEIRDVQVAELSNGQTIPYQRVATSSFDRTPETFMVSSTASSLLVEWGFSPTSNAQRTFILSYVAEGALRVYPNEDPPNQQIWWTAIGSEVTDTAPVREASATITLPQPVDPADVIPGTEGLNVEPVNVDVQTWRWEVENLDAGEELIVRLQFPMIADAAVPAWQERDDQQRAQAADREERSQFLNVIFLAIGVLGIAAGGILLFGLWYSRGRDPHAGPIADFITEPPDDLRPGAVGVLVDEMAEKREIVATMVDLANRGVLKMEEISTSTSIFGSSRDFKLTLKERPDSLRPFENELLKSLFASGLKPGDSVNLSSVKSRFDSSAERIKTSLYSEVVKRGYFVNSPEATRQRWRSFGIVMLVAVAVIGFFSVGAIAADANLVWLPIFAFGGLAVALIMLSRHMPRRTQEGAVAAAKWMAFKKYLEDIEKYERLPEHKEIFDAYLPYAIAFGLEQQWVSKFAAVDAPTPSWYEPDLSRPYDPRAPRRHYGGGIPPVIIWGNPWGGGTGGTGSFGGRPSDGGGGGGGVGLPDFQSMSDSASGGLGRSSDGLFDMFNTAGSVFESFVGGGGSSRGTGSFGGGGGFGGGFSGGGSFGGGSSGGGGRGFS
jgi:uncharacterized protein (TIGR04222 family)